MGRGRAVGIVCGVDNRWGWWRRVEYRGRGREWVWVERVLRVGLPVIWVWLGIIWVRGSSARGVRQVTVIVMTVLGFISLTKLGFRISDRDKKK